MNTESTVTKEISKTTLCIHYTIQSCSGQDCIVWHIHEVFVQFIK